MTEEITTPTATPETAPAQPAMQPTQEQNIPAEPPPAEEQTTQGTATEGILVKYDDGTEEVITPDQFNRMMERDRQHEGLTTKLGHMSNEIGELRAKTRQTSSAQQTPAGDDSFEITEDDLADPKMLTKKLNAIKEDARKSAEQIRTESAARAEADQLIEGNPRLKAMNISRDEKIAIINSAIDLAQAHNNSVGHVAIANRKSALDHYFGVLSGTSNNSPAINTNRTIRSLQRTSQGLPAPQVGDTSTNQKGRAEIYATLPRNQSAGWLKANVKSGEMREFMEEVRKLAPQE